MWTVENRVRYDRSQLRYPSDLTDEEWALVKRQIPRAKRGGNKRTVDEREVMNGLMYVLSTGCQWRAIPKDLPPRSTVNHYFCRWQHDGTLDRLHHALYVLCREQAERQASPTAAIIVKSLPNPTPISRPITTPVAVRNWALNGLRSCREGAVGKWPAGATVESLA
jgi:transposase